MDAATAWEQTQIARLFLRHISKPKTLIFSLDANVWCDLNADLRRTTFRIFPKSLYDENLFNDFSDILTLELWDALRKSIKVAFGARSPYQDSDGFGDFTPGEANYDATRARGHIYDGVHPRRREKLLGEAELKNMEFPALIWLAETLETVPPSTDVIFARMPVHSAALPVEGTRIAQVYRECFRQIGEIASRHHTPMFNMAFASSITTNDFNYWDRLHYRLPVGNQIVGELARAHRTGQPSPTLKISVPLGR